jgi:hypothetical protein
MTSFKMHGGQSATGAGSFEHVSFVFSPPNYYSTIVPCSFDTLLLRYMIALTRPHIVTSSAFRFKALFSDSASESYVFLIPYV